MGQSYYILYIIRSQRTEGTHARGSLVQQGNHALAVVNVVSATRNITGYEPRFRHDDDKKYMWSETMYATVGMCLLVEQDHAHCNTHNRCW